MSLMRRAEKGDDNVGADILKVEYENANYKGTDGVSNADMAEKLYDLFMLDGKVDTFFIQDRKEAIKEIKEAEIKDKKLEKALIAFIKNNPDNHDYAISW